MVSSCEQSSKLNGGFTEHMRLSVSELLCSMEVINNIDMVMMPNSEGCVANLTQSVFVIIAFIYRNLPLNCIDIIFMFADIVQTEAVDGKNEL